MSAGDFFELRAGVESDARCRWPMFDAEAVIAGDKPEGPMCDKPAEFTPHLNGRPGDRTVCRGCSVAFHRMMDRAVADQVREDRSN